ncbi:MAG: beta-lactamase family protein [Bacteroidales bacterium]|nr:beta-lactamase family protein [Bacteroidales bacterium]
MNFKKTFGGLFVLLATTLLLSGCGKDVPTHDIDIEIQKVMAEKGLPSVSACVIKNNAIVWQQSYGYSNKENQLKASDETIYHIASISKLFIATAIMQLEEQGLINIDKDVNNFIPVSIRNPHFPGTPITVRMLLTHTSGIAWPQTYREALGIWEHFEPDQAPPPSEWVPQFLIPSGEHYNPLIWKHTAPGTFELYSNIGSNVLAYIVEQVSGHNFREYCMEHIFLPLDMQNTSYNYADLELSKMAVLYNDNNTIQQAFDDRIYASGGLKTTIQDLSRFMITYINKGELDGQRVLQENTVEKMFEIQNKISGVCLLWRASLGGWFGHTGGMAGAATTAEINPENKTGLIIFCNKHSNAVYQGHDIYGLVKQKANEFID